MKSKILSWMIVILLALTALTWYVLSTNHATAPNQRPIDLQKLQKVTAQKISVPEIYRAVGTIKPSTESNLESKINSKILKVHVAPGEKVKAGELLIELDDRDFIARVERAQQAIEAATAVHDQNKATFQRSRNLIKSGYLSKSEFDKAKSDYLSSVARLKQAEKSLQEAQVELSHCKIKAFADGIVLDKYVDPGDQAMPGKVLLKLQTADVLQLRANVPEELIRKIKLEQNLQVLIDATNEKFTGTVVEIVPNIDPQTRTFVVKVNLPTNANIFPGMFGRLLIPIATKEIIVIPKSAIIEHGQLKFVNVIQNNRLQKIVITTGNEHDNNIQVLSGLNAGDIIAVPEP